MGKDECIKYLPNSFFLKVDLVFVENSSNPKKIMLAKHVTLTIKTVFIVFRRITLLEEF